MGRNLGPDARVGQWLILVSGLPGVGKSALVAELAPRLGASVVSRDAARLSLRPRGPRRLAETLAWRLAHRRLTSTQRRAGRLLQATIVEELQAGRPVIVEVVAEAPLRQRLCELAAAHGARMLEVECVLSDRGEHRRRLGLRPEGERFWQALVADLEIGYEQPERCLRIDTQAPAEKLADRVIAHIDGR
jgi:predicted kinase